MGLDMYLNKRVYVGNNYRSDDKKLRINVPKDLEGIDEENIINITTEVAYWRKANGIHNWFVENVQDGKDDCGEYFLYNETLRQLVEECKEDISYLKGLKEGEEPSEDLLNIKPINGFFFGSTDIDEYFIQTLEYTINTLKDYLDDNMSIFTYQSSW